jgi:hypothetical protein
MTVRREDSSYTNLCKFEFADGRLCCMPGLPSLNGFCKSHAALNRRKPPVEEDLTYELSQFFSPENGKLDVHAAMQYVFKAMCSNRISTRRAATFGYLGSLILFSDPSKIPDAQHRREIHDLYNYTYTALKTVYGRNAKRALQSKPKSESSPQATKPSPASSSSHTLEPASTASSMNNSRRTQ